MVLVEIGLSERLGAPPPGDTPGVRRSASQRIEATYRLLRASDRADLGQETTVARGQEDPDSDARHDAIAAALLDRLYARLGALVP